MPFVWKPTSNSRRKVSSDTMKNAVQRVLENGKSLNAAAKEFNVDRKTLGRYVNKVKKGEETEFKANHVSCQILSDAEEEKLEQYVLQSSRLNYGLTPTITRKFAYQYALANGKKVPQNWTKNKMASYDWLRGFMSRHQKLSLRTPQATSLSRATAFNKTTVQEFYNNLKTVFSKVSYGPDAIFNVDETGMTTVQKPGKVIAPKGEKQVSRATSAERGTLVTACCAISAIGVAVPPFFVFPRKRLNDRMLIGAPPGSGVVAHESGWMTGENFEKFLLHFVQFTKCSISKPVVIVLDNHESHITPSGLQICKNNGVTLVTLPPHTSHKLQPLDRSVFGPFKNYYNAAADDYMVTHPGQTISIYDIPQLVAKAFPKAFTPSNIQKGFACTGIWPFNSNNFSEADFLSSYVSDRDDPNVEDAATIGSTSSPIATTSTSSNSKKGTLPPSKLNSRITRSHQLRSGSNNDAPAQLPDPITSMPKSRSRGVTPEELRPFPKAPARKTKGGRKRVVSRILTDSPVKKQIEADHEARAAKKIKIINANKEREDRMKKSDKAPCRKAKKKTP